MSVQDLHLVKSETGECESPAINLIKSPRAAEDWWQTPRGQQTETYLRAWGLTTRGRKDTGDMSYVPAMDSDSVEGYRGPRTNVADVLLRYIDVDRVLRTVPNGPRRVVYWVFVDSITTRHQHRAMFSDGSVGDWTHGPQPKVYPPQVASYEEDIRQSWSWEWENFPAQAFERDYWRDWNITPSVQLARSFEHVGKFVAKELGL